LICIMLQMSAADTRGLKRRLQCRQYLESNALRTDRRAEALL
jgi:hypothetical protein